MFLSNEDIYSTIPSSLTFAWKSFIDYDDNEYVIITKVNGIAIFG
jgi:hypothetical protein